MGKMDALLRCSNISILFIIINFTRLEATRLNADVSYIIDGIRTTSAEFPHVVSFAIQVALGYGSPESPTWNCGGTLISDKYVLTAAHCLYSREDGDVQFIRAGTTKLSKPSPSFEDYKIEEAIPHPNYTFPAKYHDIALLKLNRTVIFGPSIGVAALDAERNSNRWDFIAVGWGSISQERNLSDDLMKVGLVSYNYDTCKKFYTEHEQQLPLGVKEELMICAGGKVNEKKDTCFGDSGGPLLMADKQYVVSGITSFGRTCGTPNVPAIYTKVSYYVEWIKSIVSK